MDKRDGFILIPVIVMSMIGSTCADKIIVDRIEVLEKQVIELRGVK